MKGPCSVRHPPPLVGILVTCAIYGLWRIQWKSSPFEFTPPSSTHTPEAGGLPACGEVCTYNGTVLPGDARLYPKLRKHIECDDILSRMAYTDHLVEYPPPRQPPQDMYDAFTQMGDMPMKRSRYIVDPSAGGENKKHIIHQREKLDNMAKRMQRGENINTYRDNGCMMKLLTRYKTTVEKASGVVFGTQRPWLEAMLLGLNASRITTLEYGTLTIDHPAVRVHSPYGYAELFLNNEVPRFDFGATFSSLEHSGLGRYGDPINPYGDLEAMAQAWCLIRPGGIFIVGVPWSGKDRGFIQWNAHRVYGLKRLQQMTANWELLDHVVCNEQLGHVVLALRRSVIGL